MLEIPSAIFETAGLIGVALYLGGYAALQFGVISGNSNSYTLLNLGGASFVLVSLFSEFNLASALIQISWIVISVTGLMRVFLIHRRLRFSDEEKSFLARQLPNLPKQSARRFLDAGIWVDNPEGYKILTENEPVVNLFYLSSGEVRVVSSGQLLAKVENGLLGEINVLQGTPASASVTTTQPSRLFVISRTALNRLLKTDNDFRIVLEGSINKDTGRKLVAANKRLIEAAVREQSEPIA
jgi:hypothetical protein